MNDIITVKITIVNDIAHSIEMLRVFVPTNAPPTVIHGGGYEDPISFAENPQAVEDISRVIAALQTVLKSS